MARVFCPGDADASEAPEYVAALGAAARVDVSGTPLDRLEAVGNVAAADPLGRLLIPAGHELRLLMLRVDESACKLFALSCTDCGGQLGAIALEGWSG